MIALIPVGDLDEAILEGLRQPLAEVFGQEVVTGDRLEVPPESWDSRRRQHLAPSILGALPSPAHSHDRVLAVADVDIYTPGLNFVFGQAEMSGGRAVISLHRLRQEFYGLPADDSLFRQRTLKEAVHELGHTCALGHCPDPACVMHFSNSLPDTDRKGSGFCPGCRKRLVRQP